MDCMQLYVATSNCCKSLFYMWIYSYQSCYGLFALGHNKSRFMACPSKVGQVTPITSELFMHIYDYTLIEHMHMHTLLKMICCGSKLLPVFRPFWSKNR